MNNINCNRIANQAIGFVNEQLIQALSPLQKKVMLVALLALAGIVYFAFTHCLKRAVNPEVEKKNDEALAPQQKVEEDNETVSLPQLEKWFDERGAQMKSQMLGEMGKWEKGKVFPLESAICFVNVRFKNGNIRQQYIFKNQDGSALTYDDFSTNIDKVLNIIKKDLNENLGSHDTVSWFVLFKGSEKFLKMQGYNAAVSQAGSGWIAAGKDALQTFLQIGLNSLGEDMNIPKEAVFLQDGEFVPGDHYRDINT